MFTEIRRLVSLENVTIEGLDINTGNNRIVKAERKLQLSFEAVLNGKLHQIVSKPSLGRFFIHADSKTYEIDNYQAYFGGYNFMDIGAQTFTMNISAMKDVNEHKGYMRLSIPITRSFWEHNLSTNAIKTEKNYRGGLLILKFEEGEVHVFTVMDGNTKQQYMIVEPQYEVTKDILFNIHYAVATGLGIITGTAPFGESYVLVSNNRDFISYKAVSYYALRESIRSQYVTFTTNIYWVESTLRRGEYNKYALEMITDDKGKVKNALVDWLYEKTYGNLIYNMYKYPEIARAAFILLDGTDKALDYQAAIYAVALETLCTKFKGIFEMKFNGIIKNKGTWTRIRKPMEKTFRNMCQKYDVENDIVYKIANKIPNLNDISNTDKFNMVLDKLGLNRMESDDDAMSQRNNLLHGELVKKTAEDSSDFDDMYYYSLVLHRLCTAIIFKFAGYNGYLVNNAVLMDRKPACLRREPVLIKI